MVSSFEKKSITIFALLLIYLSGSLLSSMGTQTSLYKILLYISLIIGFCFAAKGINRTIRNRKCLIVVLVALILMLIECLISAQTVSLFITRIIWFLIFISAFCYFKKKNIDFFHYVYKAVVFIAIVSLCFFIVIDILKIQLPYSIFEAGLYSRYKNYSYIYFEHFTMYSTNFWGFNFCRLHSFFWEPGVYQIYLNFALYRLLFIENESKRIEKKYILILLLLSILLTLSTTGIVLASGIILSRFYFSKKIGSKARIIFLIPLLFIIILISVNALNLKVSNYSGVVSYNLRVNDIANGFNLFLQHPLFGTGFDNHSEFYALQGSSRGNTNGIIIILYTMGLMGVILFFSPFIINIIKQKRADEKFSKIVFFIWFFISNMTEPIFVVPFVWLVYANEVSSLCIKNSFKTLTNNGIFEK